MTRSSWRGSVLFRRGFHAGVRLQRWAVLTARIWGWYLRIAWLLRHRPLPTVVRQLSTPPRGRTRVRHPRRLNRALRRVLRIGPWQPRCLLRALVLYRLLRTQGDEPELVIGLAPAARSRDAHAWVELGGHDVGPPPGRGDHIELVRYGAAVVP